MVAQNPEDGTDKEVQKSPSGQEVLKHEDLETELEFYPLNIVVPNDPVIKTEAMIDYHRHSSSGRFLRGTRFFLDENTHWKNKRDMKDLIMYTELYWGFRNFQLGCEIGSVTAEEFFTLGPQYTTYDGRIFKRLSIISRLWPDYVFGYEFTTQELKILPNWNLSSTGMGRMVLPSKQAVIQASLWVSHDRLKGIFFGLEYEFNNAENFHEATFERKNEIFFGIKAELH